MAETATIETPVVEQPPTSVMQMPKDNMADPVAAMKEADAAIAEFLNPTKELEDELQAEETPKTEVVAPVEGELSPREAQMFDLMKSMQQELKDLKTAVTPKAPTPRGIEDEEIFNEADYDQVFAREGINREAFNKVLQKTAALAMQHAYAKIPELVMPLVSQTLSTFQTQEDFFRISGNEELRKHRGLLNTEMRRLYAENPALLKDGDWTPLFEKAGASLRALIKAPVSKPVVKRPISPDPSGSRSSRSAPSNGKTNSPAADLAAMLSAPRPRI